MILKKLNQQPNKFWFANKQKFICSRKTEKKKKERLKISLSERAQHLTDESFLEPPKQQRIYQQFSHTVDEWKFFN